MSAEMPKRQSLLLFEDWKIKKASPCPSPPHLMASHISDTWASLHNTQTKVGVASRWVKTGYSARLKPEAKAASLML
jgi:hypothetical protein